MIATALVAGAVVGFAGSVPVSGPVSATVFRQGLSGAYRSGFAMAVGGAVAKGLYAAAAAWGAATLLVASPTLERATLVLGALLLGAVGIGLLVRGPRTLESRSGWRPGVGTGFLVTLCNPTVVVTFSVVTGLLRSGGVPIDGPIQAGLFGLGTALGMAGWFAVLLRTMRRYRGRLGERGRLWISRVMGALLCALALACGWSTW